MLSRKDAAEFLGCSQQTVSNWVETGILKGHKINDRLFVDAGTLGAIADTVKEMEASRKRINELRDEYDKERRELEDAVERKRRELFFFENSDANRITKTAVVSMIKSFKGFLPGHMCEVLVELVHSGNPDSVAQRLGMSTMNVLRISSDACRRIGNAKYEKKVEENEYLLKRVMELERENECLRKGIPCEKKAEDNPLFNTKIEDCDLTVRALTCLRTLGAETFGDVLKAGKRELLGVRNMGRKTLAEIEEYARMNGLTLE